MPISGVRFVEVLVASPCKSLRSRQNCPNGSSQVDFFTLGAFHMQLQYLLKYLSTAPVLAAAWMFVTAGVLIEFNRFFPDFLFSPIP